MKTLNGQKNIEVTILASRYGWQVQNNATGMHVFGKNIKSGKTLVALCNENGLKVTNPTALVSELRAALKDRPASGKTKLAIYGPFNGTFEVHAADCADCKKAAQRAHDSRLSVSSSIWSDFIKEGSMTASGGLSEIDFKPCVKL